MIETESTSASGSTFVKVIPVTFETMDEAVSRLAKNVTICIGSTTIDGRTLMQTSSPNVNESLVNLKSLDEGAQTVIVRLQSLSNENLRKRLQFGSNSRPGTVVRKRMRCRVQSANTRQTSAVAALFEVSRELCTKRETNKNKQMKKESRKDLWADARSAYEGEQKREHS